VDGVVEVVPGVVVLVAGVVVVVVDDGVVVVLEVVGRVVVEGVVVVVVVDVVVELVVGREGVVWQSRWASTPTVLAPCSRLVRSVGLTVAGRFVTASAKDTTARVADTHWPESTAEETASSWLFRFDD
jgi:hypothetical protein